MEDLVYTDANADAWILSTLTQRHRVQQQIKDLAINRLSIPDSER